MEQRCIDELWRRMWRRKDAERGKLVEEARAGDVRRRRTERGERSEVGENKRAQQFRRMEREDCLKG
jgi:hypothetical protein